MKLVANFLKNFLNRSGGYIFVASILSRLLSFSASWLALQFVNHEKLGVVLFSWNIITFLIPIVGLGLHQSYIRYGALLKEETEKKILLAYVLKKGVLVSVMMTVGLLVFCLIWPFALEQTNVYLAALSLVFVPMFLYEITRIKALLEHRNKDAAGLDMGYNFILIVLVALGSYFFQEIGYTAALILAPLITFLLQAKQLLPIFKDAYKPSYVDKEFWKYGFYGGLANVATILLFSIDILLVGHLLQDSMMVTIYKYVSVIPLSMLFLPRVFMTTDFVTFTEQISNRRYVYDYIKSYMLVFAGISVGFLLFFISFADQVLSIFDPSFVVYAKSFKILCIGVVGILLFRGLFGNLLSSIGKIHINYWISVGALCLNVISNYYLIPIWGIEGAAITSACIMWFTGIASCIAFMYFYSLNKWQIL